MATKYVVVANGVESKEKGCGMGENINGYNR